MKKGLVIPAFFAGMLALALPISIYAQGTASSAKGAFLGDYTQSQKTQYIQYGMELNGRMADEGFVLLKNDGSLPMAKGSRLSVVGKSSTNLARGGAGSGAGSITSGVTGVDLQKSLTDAGFVLNGAFTTFYGNNSQSGSGRTNGNTSWRGISQVTIGETPMSSYSSELLASLDDYNDAIIQVITREGSEGCDVKAIDCRDNNDLYPATTKHALELSDNEQALFDEIKTHTDHVIIVINSSNVFECDKFMKDSKVSGILWIGNPGDVGPGAVGRILCGDVNPSGHTVDTWGRDFTKDPVFQNWSDNQQHNPAVKDYTGLQPYAPMDTMLTEDGLPMMSYGTYKAYNDRNNIPYGADYSQTKIPHQWAVDNKVMPGGVNGVKPAAYVSYEEGIYMDYRYYETRYADLAKTNQAAADAWYNGDEGVVFPFGYGLSYTTFSQEIVRTNIPANSALTANNRLIELSVKVTNTGTKAGKDVVQAYWRAPYTPGGIEKADRVLCAFDKTKVLAPGESQTVHLKFYLQDVANYDFSDANNNQFKGYELDAGAYSVAIGKNAHEIIASVNYTVSENIQYSTDRFSGHEVKNRFTDRGFHNTMPGPNDIEFTQFSRADFEGTFPTHPTDADRRVKAGSRFEEFLTHRFTVGEFEEGNYETIPEEAHKTAADATNWSQPQRKLQSHERMQLSEMTGVDLNDPKWDTFINQFSWDEMMLILERNAMASPAINEIGKPRFSEGDGPQKFSIMWWVSSPIVAATWNPELAHEQGDAIGMEAHINNKSGWWGPGVNTHRSPFGGRNFEYYSADPFLMGRMAANVVGAATDRGVYAYFKHFAVNDQEKNRESGISFVNEQALREIYLKSFQMVFEEGKSIGVMGSYNRVGLMETAASYPLMTEVLRGEWGFKGAVLSDMTHSGNSSVNFKCYECVTNRCIAGCNSQLDSSGFSGQTASKWDSTFTWKGGTGAPVYTRTGSTEKKVSFTWWYAVRKAVKEIMYMSINCTGMNQGLTKVVGQKDIEIQVGDEVNLEVELPEEITIGGTFNGKTIEDISYRLNERVELPAGIKFEDGKLTGKFEYVCLARIDVIIELNLGETTGAVAYKFVIDAVPDMTNTGLDDKDPAPGKNNANVGVIIGIAGGAVVLVAAAVVAFLLIKKKKTPAAA